ncbi:hypothetical protein A5776_00850 [Mycolicibacterium elephantis]|nr:hypothetical protein A5776_00850 [Mycolicibacterium elephantis]
MNQSQRLISEVGIQEPVRCKLEYRIYARWAEGLLDYVLKGTEDRSGERLSLIQLSFGDVE